MRIVTPAPLRSAVFVGTALAGLWATSAWAVNINFVSGAVGRDIEVLRELVKPWEAETGNTVTVVPMPSSTTDQFAQYRLWLAAGNADVDVYQTDVIWAPQLADSFVDLTAGGHGGDRRALPVDRREPDRRRQAGRHAALHRRAGALLPQGPARQARRQRADHLGGAEGDRPDGDGHRARRGAADLWGFVWQGNAYEGLTCNALEWIKSYGGGQIVEPDGTISVNNAQAVAALEMAGCWVGTISPPGVLSYTEEESRGVWQTGNAVFMRNWPYAYALGNGDDSPIKDKFDVTPLPAGTGEGPLGGDARRLEPRGVEVLAEPGRRDRAGLYLTSAEMQKARALMSGHLPTIQALYDDPEIAASQLAHPALEGSVPERRAAAVGADQGQVQRGVSQVLDRRCTRRCPAPRRRPTTSTSSSST